jgi:hypothetical protein
VVIWYIDLLENPSLAQGLKPHKLMPMTGGHSVFQRSGDYVCVARIVAWRRSLNPSFIGRKYFWVDQELSTFYRRWIIANGLAEAVGLGGTFILGFLFSPIFESDSLTSIIFVALLAIVMGTLLEGIVIGIAQCIPLRALVPEIRVKSWITATALGAGLAWMIGMIPSTVMGLMNVSSPENATPEPPAYLQYGLAVGMGIIAGPILGIAQWIVLRHHFSNSSTWLIANAVAWSIGMPIIFIGMELVPWDAHILVIGLVVILVCFTTGVIVGTIHGWFLIHLVRKRRGTVAA